MAARGPATSPTGASVSGSTSTGTTRRPCNSAMRAMSGWVMAVTSTSSPDGRANAVNSASHADRTDRNTAGSARPRRRTDAPSAQGVTPRGVDPVARVDS